MSNRTSADNTDWRKGSEAKEAYVGGKEIGQRMTYLENRVIELERAIVEARRAAEDEGKHGDIALLELLIKADIDEAKYGEGEHG